MSKKKLATVALAAVLTLALPGVAGAHSVNQSWFEDHADQAAYGYAHSGDWYDSELGTSTNPTYSHGARHYHAWNARLFRMDSGKTRLCWKDVVIYWHGFDHTVGHALASGCEYPRQEFPDGQWRELDLNDMIGDLGLWQYG